MNRCTLVPSATGQGGLSGGRTATGCRKSLETIEPLLRIYTHCPRGKVFGFSMPCPVQYRGVTDRAREVGRTRPRRVAGRAKPADPVIFSGLSSS